MQEDLPGPSTSDPECYIIVHNVAKKHNIGTLLLVCPIPRQQNTLVGFLSSFQDDPSQLLGVINYQTAEANVHRWLASSQKLFQLLRGSVVHVAAFVQEAVAHHVYVGTPICWLGHQSFAPAVGKGHLQSCTCG